MGTDRLEDVIEKLCSDSGFEKDMALYIMDTYLKQSNEILTAAFETLSRFESDAFVKVGSLMHKLKGSSGNVRAMKIMDLAIEAEDKATVQNADELNVKLQEISSMINDYSIQLSGGL